MADGQEEQPVINSSPYLNPMHQYGSSINLLTSPEDALLQLKLILSSQEIDDKTGEIHSTGEPLMNNYGINKFIGFLRSEVSQIAIMSNFKAKGVDALMDNLADTLAVDLMLNKVKYGIKEPSLSTRKVVYAMAINYTYITLMRGYEEGDRRFWKGSVQEIHSKIENDKKPSFMGSLSAAINPFKKS